ncbi:hypothetical protein E4K65_12310 [Bradyrhizobium niftali]|uniref:Uncharacterized protein n=1 Tax=Bradyrhizobium niftali TaxID=2560055 RepID=A0A4Y9M0Y8_9BRAD|nr:hypothetical protein E4K65_12310 [Bradyrhizobium niftali]
MAFTFADLTVTFPDAGALTRRIVGRGPDVQSGSTLMKMPTRVSLLGADLTVRSTGDNASSAKAGATNPDNIAMAADNNTRIGGLPLTAFSRSIRCKMLNLNAFSTLCVRISQFTTAHQKPFVN